MNIIVIGRLAVCNLLLSFTIIFYVGMLMTDLASGKKFNNTYVTCLSACVKWYNQAKM